MTAADDPSHSAARRALVAYARRTPTTQADIDRVMRALVEHEDWYVPTSFAERGWGQAVFGQTVRFTDAAPSRLLTAFTDHESALLAQGQGQAVGRYGGPVPGVALMRSLDGNGDALIVNPASPREHQWYIASRGFPIAREWANAIAVERALAARRGGALPVYELLAHRYQLLLDRKAGTFAQIHLPDFAGPVAVCFTATDRGEEFFNSIPPGARALADIVVVDATHLFQTMYGSRAAAIVINAGSDDQTALGREDIVELAGLGEPAGLRPAPA